MSLKPSNTDARYQTFDEDSIRNFVSGKFIQSRSLDVDADILADKQNVDRRSYKYRQNTDNNFDNEDTFSRQRSLENEDNYNYQNFDERSDEFVDLGRSLRFPIVDEVESQQVSDRNKFRSGIVRGTSRHPVHNSVQQRVGQKHREEVRLPQVH